MRIAIAEAQFADCEEYNLHPANIMPRTASSVLQAVAPYRKSLGAKSCKARRQDSHSCAVPGDSKYTL